MAKKDIKVVVDLGSHTLRALLFSYGTDGGMEILKKAVLHLPAGSHAKRTADKLREILFATIKNFEKIPSSVVVALGPHMGEMEVAVWKARVLPRDRALSYKDLETQFENLAEARRDPSKTQLTSPANIYVNGYAVPRDRLDIRGKINELDFGVLVFSMPREVGDVLVEARRSFGGMTLDLTPVITAEAEALVKRGGTGDFLMVDVGWESSVLTLVVLGSVAGVVSFPLGRRKFLEGIAGALSVSLEEAEDWASQHIQEVEMQKLQAPIRETFGRVAASWQAEFLKALDSFYASGPLPQRIFFFGGGAHFPELQAALRHPEWIKKYSPWNGPEVVITRAENLFGGDTFRGALRGPEEVGLASLIIYSLEHKPIF